MKNERQPHKAEGSKPINTGESVYITDYVFGGKHGTIMGREDTDDADSYNYFVYIVAVDGCGTQYLTEFDLRRA